MHRGRAMSRSGLSARVAPWIAIIAAVVGAMTVTHKGLSQVEQIPGLVAQVDSLKAQAILDRAWKHDMAYMSCVNFQQSHSKNEVPAVCESATK